MNYGQALEALKEGKCVSRKNWMIGSFVYKQIDAEITMDIIPKMTSVPDSAKEIFKTRESSIIFRNQMNKVAPSNAITTFIATTGDIFADDWFILPS